MDIIRQTRRQFLVGGSGAALGVALAGTSLAPIGALAAEKRRGGTLRVSVADRAASLNPFVQLNNNGYLLNEMMYMGITRIGEGMKAEGDAVEAWEANADATEFVFTMRRGVVFHNGAVATAADAVASIKAVLDPKNASPAMRSIGPISDVATLDDHRFKVTLKSPYADLPVALAHINLRLIPASVLETDPKILEAQDMGSGPFRLVSHDPGRKVVVGRFDKYFDSRYPLLDSVEVIIYPDPAAESAALLNGEVDVMLRAGNADFERLSKARNLTGRRQETGGFMNIVLRTDTKPLDDVRVRHAIQKCLDRDALRTIVLEGFGRPAYDNVISPEYRYAVTVPPMKPDHAAAKRLLAEAGHPRGIRFTCYASNTPGERATLAVAFKEMLKPAGIEVDVQVVPYDQYVANIWRKAGCYVALWNMAPNEDGMFTQFLTSDAPYNDSAYNNPEFDRLVAEARATTDEAQRAAKYRAAQEMLMRDLPWLVPFYRDYLSVHGKYVMDYTTHPLTYPHFIERVWLAEGAPRQGR